MLVLKMIHTIYEKQQQGRNDFFDRKIEKKKVKCEQKTGTTVSKTAETPLLQQKCGAKRTP